MTCQDVRSQLSWYLDGELAPPAAGEVRAHLEICPACTALQAETAACDRQVTEALKSVRPSPDFARRVVAAASPRPRLAWLKKAAVAASLLIAVVGIVTAYVNQLEAPPLAVVVRGAESLHADSMAALRVFVTNASTGRPVAGASVAIRLADRDLGKFRTGEAGSIDGFFRVPDLPDGSYPLKLAVESSEGAETMERPVTVRREYKLLVTTDKPLYQPGQAIRMRALALNAFTLKPRAGEAEFEVLDSKGNRVFAKKTALSEFGIGSAELALADEVNLGTYRIAVTASGIRQERTVEVARYVLPKFRVELELDKLSYRPGEAVKGVVRAKYFFGKAVRGRVVAKVGAENVAGELREDGTWEFQAPAPEAEGQVAVTAQVTDTADHVEAKAAAAAVSREPLKVALVPEGGQVVPNLENTFFVLVSTPDGRPAKAELSLGVNGKRLELPTDDLGVAKFAAGPPYEITLERARDASGSETKVMSSALAYSSNDFLIQLDKASYRAGETMKVRVLGRRPVYLDLVKGGQLLLAKAVDTPELEIDLPPDLFGTVQVLAYAANGAPPAVRVAYVNLPEGLRIRPRVAKETFRPGEPIEVEFEVTDKEGKALVVAMGLAAIDEALFGLVESRLASEKHWLGLSRELIETRGFLRVDAEEIYREKRQNAQAFVSANAHARPPGEILRGSYEQRVAELREFVESYNEFLAAVGATAGIFLGIGLVVVLLGVPLVRGLQELPAARVSGVTVLWIVVGILLVFALALGLSGGHPEGFAFLSLVGLALALGTFATFWWVKRGHGAAAGATLLLTLVGFVTVLVVFGSGGSKGLHTYGFPAAYRASEGGASGGDASSPREEPRPAARERLLEGPRRDPFGPPQPSVSPPVEAAPRARLEFDTLPPREPASEPARVREYFPETLFWLPELITDERGRARVTLPPADSITSWRLLANAISKGGALGFETANLRVFQDFFVDIDFPVALTKGDRVHVPVAVYNYLKEPQTVTVRVDRQPWFELLDEESKSIALRPEEVSVVYFGFRVKEHGRKSLTVYADGGMKDAIRRSVEVMEKGREVPVSASERVSGRHTFRIEIPERAIEGASVVFVRLSRGITDFEAGLDGMIRMPYG